MQKINNLNDLNFKELKTLQSFYKKKYDESIDLYTVMSNEFNCLLKINIAKQKLYFDKNNNINSKFIDDYLYYIYNNKVRLKLDKIEYFNHSEIFYYNYSDIYSIILLEIYDVYLKSKKYDATIRTSKTITKDLYLDFIVFKYNEQFHFAFATAYNTYRKERIINKNLCFLINDNKENNMISLKPSNCNNLDIFKEIYKLCDYNDMVEDFVNESSLFVGKDLISIFKDKKLLEIFKSICNSLDYGYKFLNPICIYKNNSYYKNVTLDEDLYIEKFIIKEDKEYKHIEDNDNKNIAEAFYDYYENKEYQEQLFDPRDLNTLNKEKYEIVFKSDKYLKIRQKKYGNVRYYRNIDGLFVFDDTIEIKNIINDAINTYNKLLECEI